MMQLTELQRAFQRRVLRGDKDIEQEVARTGGIPAATRLGIYSMAYRLRLLEALQKEYTALHAALGDEDFEQLCLGFIEAFPSKHPNLRWFGAELCDYLRATPPYVATPVLAELARFEWALGLAFDAADDSCLAVHELAAIPGDAWPSMSFQAHASVRRLDLYSNAPLIWKAVDGATDPPPPTFAAMPSGWVVWRQDLQTFFRSLEADEAWALDAMMRGAAFGEICEGLCEWMDELHVAQHAAGLLRGWLESGMIHGARPAGH